MCVTLDELKENPQKFLREADSVVSYCSSVTITDNHTRRLLNGGELVLERCNLDAEVSYGDLIRVYSYDNKFLGLGFVEGELLKIKCIITE